MSNKVSLSGFDRALSFHQSITLERISSINEAILKTQIEQNNAIGELNKQLSQANKLNQEILQNQINEIKKSEEQKLFKALLFHIIEIKDKIYELESPELQYYFLLEHKARIIQGLKQCMDVLIEVDDKERTKELLKLASSKMKSLQETQKDSLVLKLYEKLNEVQNTQVELKSIIKQKIAEISAFPIPEPGFMNKKKAKIEMALANRKQLEDEYNQLKNKLTGLSKEKTVIELYEAVQVLHPNYEIISIELSEKELAFRNKYLPSYINESLEKDIERAIDLVIKEQKCSEKQLIYGLKLTGAKSRKIIMKLEEMGVIDFNRGNVERGVLVKNRSDILSI